MYLGPVLVTFAVGAALIVLFFVPHHQAQAVNAEILEWATIVYAFALILGSISLWNTHARKVRHRIEGWPYSLVTMITLVAVTGLGVVFGTAEGDGGLCDLPERELAARVDHVRAPRVLHRVRRVPRVSRAQPGKRRSSS
jgi:hypothetical protein